MVNPRVFRSRGFSFGVLALSLCFGTYFASIVVIPAMAADVDGLYGHTGGIVTGFTAMSALTTSAIAARLVGKVDARIMASCAMTWLGIMALWRTTHWTADVDFWTLALPQMVQGVAMPFFIVPLTTITLGAVPPSEVPSAAGLQNFLRTMASAVAASIVLTLWETSQRVSHSEIVSSLNPDDNAAHALEHRLCPGSGVAGDRQPGRSTGHGPGGQPCLPAVHRGAVPGGDDRVALAEAERPGRRARRALTGQRALPAPPAPARIQPSKPSLA